MAVTLSDIAHDTGLSISTVSRVTSGRGYVSPEAREKITESMARLGYHHHKQRRPVSQDTGDLVLVLIGGISNSVSSRCVELLCKDLAQKRKQPLVGITGFSAEREQSYLSFAMDQRVFGIITLTLTESPETVKILRQCPSPIVMLGRYLPMRRLDCLHADYYKMGFDAASYLIERGHSRIAFVGGSRQSTITQDKFLGFTDCMHSHDLPLIEAYDLHMNRLGFQDGSEAVERVLSLSPRPTALITSNDSSAAIVDGLVAHGVSVPEDISVISCEDTPLTTGCQVPITGMTVDYDHMCRDAVKTLMRRKRHPDLPFTRAYYDPTIIERKSVTDLTVEIIGG